MSKCSAWRNCPGQPAPKPYAPEHWRFGQLYKNSDDPALFVPTRDGSRWTLNFGRPVAAALMGADRMCVSTDYPHFDSNFPNVANNVLKGCSRDTAAKILFGGAGIYGFTEADFEKADKAAAGLTISVEAKGAAMQAA